MPEDRFGDLGPRAERSPSARPRDPLLGDDPRPAAERLAELDAARPEEPLRNAGPPDRPSPLRRRGGRYVGIVAVVFAALVVVAAFNSALDLGGDGDLLRGPPPGSILPDFAAPLATGSLEGDANVRQRAGEGDDAAGARPACEVRGPQIVNVCELRERPLVLTFIVTRGTDCATQLGALERVRREYPGVAFAAVVSGSDREDVAELVRERDVTMPVAVDPDGVLVNLFRVGVCPTTVIAERGGRVREARLGNLDESRLRAAARGLSEGAR